LRVEPLHKVVYRHLVLIQLVDRIEIPIDHDYCLDLFQRSLQSRIKWTHSVIGCCFFRPGSISAETIAGWWWWFLSKIISTSRNNA